MIRKGILKQGNSFFRYAVFPKDSKVEEAEIQANFQATRPSDKKGENQEFSFPPETFKTTKYLFVVQSGGYDTKEDECLPS
jgi:hypothetical protein